jgi:DNA-binding SARP family transcriptional activator
LGYWLGVGRLPYSAQEARSILEPVYARFRAAGDVAGRYLSWCAIVDTFVFEWNDFTPLDRWLEEADNLGASPPPNNDIAQRFAGAMFMASMNRRPAREFVLPWEEQVQDIVLHHSNLEMRTTFGNHLILYKTWITGDLARAETILRTLRPLVQVPGTSALVKMTFGTMTGAYLWRSGDGDGCLHEVETALTQGHAQGVHLWDGLLYSQALFALMTNDRWDEAQDYLARLEALLPHARPLERMMYHYFRGWFALAHHDSNSAVHHGEIASELAAVAGASFPLAIMRLAWALCLYHVGERQHARSLVARARDAGLVMGSQTVIYQAALAEAEFALDEGRTADVVDALRGLLAVAHACGIRAHGWWRSSLMARLYALALDHGIEPDYVRAVIRQRRLAPPRDGLAPAAWPFPIKLYTFGRFGLVRDDASLESSGRAQKKGLDLLKALVALGGREVSEQKLCDLLWPDAEADDARANLKMTLHRLRAHVGHEAVVVRESRFSLDPHHCWVDVWAFERVVGALLVSGPTLSCAELTYLGEQLLQLYRGAFLAQDDGNYTLLTRERLRAKWMRALAAVAEGLQRVGEHDQALRWYERGMATEPLGEPFYQGYMRACLSLRRAAEGLALYERLRRLLAGQLQIPPSPETETLALALRESGA